MGRIVLEYEDMIGSLTLLRSMNRGILIHFNRLIPDLISMAFFLPDSMKELYASQSVL